MSTVTVRLNPEEQRAFSEYAKLSGTPLSTLMKKALEEKMEYEFDMKMIHSYEKDVKEKKIEVVDHDEVKKLLGI